MSPNKEMLIEQYRQCNEHLRDSNRKRDLILGFYVTMTVALYGLSGRISAEDTKLLFGIVGLVALGILLGALLTLFRGWHVAYVLQAIAFHEMVHREKPVIDKTFVKEVDIKFNYFISVELLVFVMLHSIVFLNCGAALMLATNVVANGWWYPFIIGLIVMAVLEFLSHFFAMWLLDHWKETGKLGPRYLWLLQSTVRKWP